MCPHSVSTKCDVSPVCSCGANETCSLSAKHVHKTENNYFVCSVHSQLVYMDSLLAIQIVSVYCIETEV